MSDPPRVLPTRQVPSTQSGEGTVTRVGDLEERIEEMDSLGEMTVC